MIRCLQSKLKKNWYPRVPKCLPKISGASEATEKVQERLWLNVTPREAIIID